MLFVRPLAYALIVVSCLAGPAALAYAAEAPEDTPPTSAEIGADLVDDLVSAIRAKDADKIKAHVARIGDAYLELDDEDVRAELLKAVGKASRLKDEDLQAASLRAFIVMKDAGAWKYVARFLKQRDRRAKPALFDHALRVVEAARPDAAVSVLLTHVQKSKHLGVASLSMKALGVYGASRHRVKILETIIDTTRKEMPGVKGRQNPNYYGPRYTGEEARNRWEALGRPMVEAANRLTGQDADSPDEWFAIWSDHKRKPKSLFIDG